MTEPAVVPARIEVSSYPWPDVTPDVDLVAQVAQTLELRDGDVLLLTSKVVSKADGLLASGRRADVVDAESVRVLARRGAAVIAETRHGLVMAAAGVDASNVAPGLVVTLPVDSDESARRLRSGLYDSTGRNVAVIVTDTAGRAWRNGQTDMAVGCAGMAALLDLAGTLDTHGNLLSVTAPAVADELAAAADLVKGKTSGRPLAVVRGLRQWVLPAGESGPGATTLIRHSDDDLFGLGARDAVHAAASRRDTQALAHFPKRVAGDPEPFADVRSTHTQARVTWARDDQLAGSAQEAWVVQVDVEDAAGAGAWLEAGRLLEKVDSLAAAHRLHRTELPTHENRVTGWQTVTRALWSIA